MVIGSRYLKTNIIDSIKSNRINGATVEEIESILISADIGLDVTNQLIKKKIESALYHKLNIIFCIGETSEEKIKHKTFSVLVNQIRGSIEKKYNFFDRKKYQKHFGRKNEKKIGRKKNVNILVQHFFFKCFFD